MNKKVLFNETLTSLVEYAAASDNRITMDDVILYFNNLIEDESQYAFIFEYLNSKKIQIEGYANQISNEDSNIEVNDSYNNNSDNYSFVSGTGTDNVNSTFISEESEEEMSFIKMYMDEMNNISPAVEGEIDSLVEELMAGNLSAKDRLVECNLKMVADIAEKYRNKGVHFGDLIQEGNLGLMMAIAEYTPECGDFNTFVKGRIMSAIEETINAQINSSRVGTHLADRLNRLDEVTKNLSEKYGRVPSIKELAEAMSISEDEASQLLKISLDTLSVNEDTQIIEESEHQSVSSDDTSIQSDPLEWRVNKK